MNDEAFLTEADQSDEDFLNEPAPEPKANPRIFGKEFKLDQLKQDFNSERMGELGHALQTSPLQFLPHIQDPETSNVAAAGAKLLAPWAPDSPLTRKIAAGAIDTIQGGAEFATTPMGAALTLAGGAFPAVGRAIAAGFVPIMTEHAAQTLGGASVTKDPREITKGALESLMAAAPLAHELPGVFKGEKIKPSELRESDRGIARETELRKQIFTEDDFKPGPDDTIPTAAAEPVQPEAAVAEVPAPVAPEPVQPAVEPVATEVYESAVEKPVEPEFKEVEVGRFKDEMEADKALGVDINNRRYEKRGDDYVVLEDQPIQVDPAIKEMGADVYDPNPEAPGTYVSNMFAAIDKSRAEMGKPPMDPTVRRTWDADNQRALATMNRNPDWIPDLIKEVTDSPRPLLSWENAGMVWHRAKLKGQADNALSSLAQAFDDGRMADVESKKLEVARLEDQLDELDKAVGRNGTGSEAGRSLVAQKMAAGEDFSLIEMRLKKRAANNGKPLTAQQEAEVQALHDKLAESERRLAELEAFKSKSIADAEIDRVVREASRETFHPKVFEAAERIVQGFEARADAARARLREKLKTVGAGIDPTILLDVAEIGAGHLARKGLDFAKWSKVMIDEFGEAVQPYLEEAFKKSGELLEEGTKRSNTLVKKAVKSVATAGEKIAESVEAISETVKSKKKNDITFYVQKLARAFVESGITEREKLIDAVHSALTGVIPDITRRQAMDAISGYGDFKQLTKDQVSVQLRGMKGEMQQISKLEDMAKGTPPLKTGIERRTPTDVERELIQKVNDAKNKFKVPMTDAATQLKSALDTIKTRLANEIKDLETQIANKKQTIPNKTEAPSDAASEALKARRDELKKQYAEMFNDPEKAYKAALALYKKRITKRISELESKLAAGDFSKTPRRTLELDNEANKLKAQAEKVKHDFRQALNRDKYANRTKFERGLDMLAKWRRGIVLSGLGTLEKLTSAAIARTITTPLEELAGQGIHMAFPELSKRAPRHGGGFSTKAEVKALSESVTAGMADAWQTLKTGKSPLEYLYKRQSDPGLPPTLIDVFGHIHGALKAPVKRAEFARAFEKRMQWNAERGVDVSDEFVQARIGLEAFQDAERSIFMQKNIVADAYKRMLQRFEQPEKIEGKPNPHGKPSTGGKVLATTARVLLPIVKVPTNIVGEIMEYSIGSVTGSARLAKAYRAGIENLAPAEADLIMRQLKKGSLGAAALLLGFLNPDMFGGFYQPGTKKKDAIKPDAARIGGVDIDSHFLHNPFVETSQLGATVRKVSDSKLRKGDKETQGLTAGAMAGALGLASEVPFIREMTEIDKLINPSSRNRWLGEFANSMVVPQGVREAAQFFDKDANGEVVKRKPTNVKEAVELGIPGLRQNVPKAKR